MAPTLAPVTVKGRYLWAGNKRFLVNGVVYQPHGPGIRDVAGPLKDPLSDDKLNYLERSIPLLKELHINTLICFHVREENNHDAAMNLLAEAGIYVLPCISPVQDAPGFGRDMPVDVYKAEVVQYYFRAIDKMAQYSNTLGIVISYEYIKDVDQTPKAHVFRSIVRDVKRYMRLMATKKTQRVLPIGIFAMDVWELIKPQFDYFAAGPDSEAIDFFAFNNFFWDIRSPRPQSSYKRLFDLFSDASIPVFFSKYGSMGGYGPRHFEGTRYIYTDPRMLSVFSGGAIYEFFAEAPRYGLVEVVENPGTVGLRFNKLKDFRTLRKVLQTSALQLPGLLSTYSRPTTPLGRRPNPPKRSSVWQATNTLPRSPINWREVENEIADSEWIDVAKEMTEIAIDDLASSIWESLNVDDIEP
ncbi:glycoside hydrolase family 72 protein [Hypoxylon sp. FL1857]|nr:glycoside hydrolase family 72 protein [Hypoxylon sp. FL1857]